MKKRLISVLLVLCVAVMLLPAAALAEDSTTHYVSDAAALYALFDGTSTPQAADGDTILLEAGFALEDKVLEIKKAVTLDLGGNTLTGSTSNARIAITGIAEGKTVTIENGTIDNSAVVNIVINLSYGGKLTLAENAKLIGNCGIRVGGPDNNVTDASISAGVEVVVAGDIDARTSPQGTSGSIGITVSGNHADSTTYATFTIKDTCEITAATGTSDKPDTASGNAIYASGYAVWNIEGGTFKSSDTISIRTGVLNISGGEFTATGAYANPASGISNQSSSTGAVIAAMKDYPVTINITGGSFTSEKGAAIYSSSSDMTMSIAGGTFTSDSTNSDAEGDIPLFDAGYDKVENPSATTGDEIEYPEASITGGTFVSDVPVDTEMIKPGLEIDTSTGAVVRDDAAPTPSLSGDTTTNGPFTVYTIENAMGGFAYTVQIEGSDGTIAIYSFIMPGDPQTTPAPSFELLLNGGDTATVWESAVAPQFDADGAVVTNNTAPAITVPVPSA